MNIKDIAPYSFQAWTLFNNSQVAKTQKNITKYRGAIFMIEGMEYHFNNFMKAFTNLEDYFKTVMAPFGEALTNSSSPYPTFRGMTEIESFYFNSCEHEAIAYLNRLGQFCSFAEPFKMQHRTPRILELIIFRNKFTAHRSVDKPRGETKTIQDQQGSIFGLKHIPINPFLIFRITDGNKEIQFHIKDDHPIIMNECLTVLRSVY